MEAILLAPPPTQRCFTGVAAEGVSGEVRCAPLPRQRQVRCLTCISRGAGGMAGGLAGAPPLAMALAALVASYLLMYTGPSNPHPTLDIVSQFS